MTDFLERFRAQMIAANLTPPLQIAADGKIHRFSTNGRPSDSAGWYVLYGDSLPAGAFGCWRQGVNQSWSSKDVGDMSAAERELHGQRFRDMQVARSAEELRQNETVAAEAVRVWAAAQPALPAHPYLQHKKIQSHGARVDEHGALLLPLYDIEGRLWNVERIDPVRFTKRSLACGRRKGCLLLLGKPGEAIAICEGFASSATVRESIGIAVAAAFGKGNLEAVAVALRSRYPYARLIMAADDDWQVPGNPGLTEAQRVAKLVNAVVVVPRFSGERPATATDFNDMAACHGTAAVKDCFDQVLEEYQAQADHWPDPLPLPSALPPVQQFDESLLPHALHPWIMDIAHRMQCPPEFPATAALVALSSLVGARATMQPKSRDDWQVVPNLWGMCIGRPGVKKSPALGEAMKPLHQLQADAHDAWEDAHAVWRLDVQVAELAKTQHQKKARDLATDDPSAARAYLAKHDQTPAEPRERRFIVNDSTMEKLGEILAGDSWGLMVYRDELHGLLMGLDKQGQEGARAFYLQGYDGGGSYTFDRIGRGSTHVPRVCLALLGSIQPGRLHSYVREAVREGKGDDGLLQRFGLAVWPDCAGEFVHVDRWPDNPARQRAYAVFGRLAQLQPANEVDAVVWRFTPAAQDLFVEWLVPFEQLLRQDDLHPALVSHLAKHRKLVPALALLFALVDAPNEEHLVDAPELLRAIEWAHFLRSHAERLYSAATKPELTGARILLDKIRKGKLCGRNGDKLSVFTPREVVQKEWAGLTTSDLVRGAAENLVEWGYLRMKVELPGFKGGRPSETYLVHPSLLKRSE